MKYSWILVRSYHIFTQSLSTVLQRNCSVLDAKEEDQAFKRAKALIGDPLFFKCRVQGEVHVEPSMMWYVDGSPITVTDDKLIETNLKE